MQAASCRGNWFCCRGGPLFWGGGGGGGGKASPFAILLTKSHCRVVCADGLPGVLCNLHGASSISSNVYLGFICPGGLTLGFIFRLPPAAAGPSSFWTAATCRLPYWVSGCSSLRLPLFCWLLVLLLLRLFSLLSFRLRPWFPVSDCGAPGHWITPPTSSWIGRIAESDIANAFATFMSSASDVKSLRSSLCFSIESARHPSVKY